MRTPRWIPGGIHFTLVTLVAGVVLVAGCTGATSPTPSPGGSGTPAPSSGPPTGQPPSGSHVAGSWMAAGTMVWPRHSPIVVRLADGRVLAVGEGSERGTVVSDRSHIVEIWDPATDSWRDVEPLNKSRGDPAVVALRDGRALVAGGLSDEGRSFSSAYVLDPADLTWSKVGLMGAARHAPAAAVLPDGRVLVAGGAYCTGFDLTGSGVTFVAWTADVDPGLRCLALATAELFDPATGEWTDTGPMLAARSGARAVTLASGKALVWGGGEGAVPGGELYDPAKGEFSAAGELPPVDRVALARLGVPLPPGNPGRTGEVWPYGSIVPLAGEAGVLLIGAGTEWGDLTVSAIYHYTPAMDTWAQVGDPWATSWEDVDGESVVKAWGSPPPLGFAVGLADGTALFGGGQPADWFELSQAGGTVLGTRDVALLDPAAGTWTLLPDMPSARLSAVPVLLADGSVLVVGGYANGGDGNPVPLGDTFRYVPGE